MAKVRSLNLRVRVVPYDKEDGGPNPFQRGSFKRAIFGWALEQGTFTKGEFFAAAKDIAEETGYAQETEQPDAYQRAWWNEFWSRHKCFKEVTE